MTRGACLLFVNCKRQTWKGLGVSLVRSQALALLDQSWLGSGTGFSQPAAVFHLAGLWWPKSLRSKATHAPAILMPQGLLCPVAALPSLGGEKILCSQHELSVYLTSSLIFLKDLAKIPNSINPQNRLLRGLLVLDSASLARL